MKYKYKPGLAQINPHEINLLADEKFDPLFDKRAQEKPDSYMVAEMMTAGWHHGTVLVVERESDVIEGETELVIVAGRRRVLAAREAGLATVDANVLPHDTAGYVLVGYMLAENELREEDNALNRAVKIQRFVDSYLEQFRPDASEAGTIGEDGEVVYSEGWRPSEKQEKQARMEAAACVGVSERRVRQLLQVLDASAKVKRAIETGKVSEATVRESGILDRDHDAQDAWLERETAKAEAKGKKSVGRSAAKNGGGEASGLSAGKRKAVLDAVVAYERSPKAALELAGVLTGEIEIEEAPAWLAKALAAGASEEE